MDEIEKALAAASDEAVVEGVRRGRWAVERPPPRARQGSELPLLAVLALVMAVGVWLPARFGARPDDEIRQADLAWTVEAVAEQVEAFRRLQGRLPAPQELIPPLSEAVRYRPEGEHYTVVGHLGSLEIVLDSRTRFPVVEDVPEEEGVGADAAVPDSGATGGPGAGSREPVPEAGAPPPQSSWALRTAALARVRKMEGSSGLRM